jgi:hypothetical protein
MSVTISKESNNCVVVTVSGVFSYKDLEAVQNAAKETLKYGVKVNCLILAERFSGWGKDGNWGDLTFMYENDPLINKIAVVAQEKHKDELLMFLGAGMRQAAVKFFSGVQENEARIWLLGPADDPKEKED